MAEDVVDAPAAAAAAAPARARARGRTDGEDAPRVVVFSGGTAMNGITSDLSALTQKVTHVIPVSDNGGSTSEIVRVLGGPAVGDLRSRCLRLSDESTPEAGR